MSSKKSATKRPPPVASEATHATHANSHASEPSQIQDFLTGLTEQLKVLTEGQLDLRRRLDQAEAHATMAPSQGEMRPGADMTRADPTVTLNHAQSDLARYAQAGLIAPPPKGALPQLSPEAAEEMVAFIPKDDPLNPRNQLFETWINGRHFRSRRGQTLMLPRGHAIMLAASDHGYVVDIAAMQSVVIPRLPDYSMPDSWDGRVPQAAQSSVPAQFYQHVA